MGLVLESCFDIYDIMARCYLYMKNDKTFDFNDIDSEEQESIDNKMISKEIKLVIKAYLERKSAKDPDANLFLINSLKQLNSEWVFGSEECYQIIRTIDNNIGYSVNEINLYDSFFNTYRSLNTELNNKVRIFPIITDNYRNTINKYYRKAHEQDFLRKRIAYDSRSINKMLENYIFMDDSDFQQYTPVIHELINYECFMEHIEDDYMTVAIFPVTSVNLNDILKVKYSKNYFEIKDMDEDYENMIIDRCNRFIKSLTGTIDFLLFPEMLMTPKIIAEIEKNIEHCTAEIRFVIYGSQWKSGCNISEVKYRGENLFSYFKKIPFEISLDKKGLENLKNNCKDVNQKKLLHSILMNHDFDKNEKKIFQEKLKGLSDDNNQVHIIDINKLGRIFVFICKDVNDPKYTNTVKILHGDILFVPACSPSMDLNSVPKEMAELFHCTTFMCNTCASLCDGIKDRKNKINKKARIGFITTPEKAGSEREDNNIFYCFDKSCENCDKTCLGRIYNMNISSFIEEDNTVSMDIKEAVRNF